MARPAFEPVPDCRIVPWLSMVALLPVTVMATLPSCTSSLPAAVTAPVPPVRVWAVFDVVDTVKPAACACPAASAASSGTRRNGARACASVDEKVGIGNPGLWEPNDFGGDLRGHDEARAHATRQCRDGS
jgi:hypothetical protein